MKQGSWTGRIASAVLLMGSCVAALWWLAPGGLGGRAGLGDAQPMHVGEGLSARMYRAVAAVVADAPAAVHGLVDLTTEGSLVCLGLLLCWTWWTGLRTRDHRRTAGAVVVGIATVAAYATSEAIKLVVDEERPCRAAGPAPAFVDCPEPGDWSFPSNHAVLASALVVGVMVLWPRIGVVAVPLGALTAILRVVAGVHYPHDVLAGAVLGGVVAAVGLLLLLPGGVWAVRRLAGPAASPSPAPASRSPAGPPARG